MRSNARGSIFFATLFLLTVAAVPKLRPDESVTKRPPKVHRATSRVAPPSEKGEVPLAAGVESESIAAGTGRSLAATRRSFFASIGIVARYDVWLSPPGSTATVAASERKDGVVEARSRDVEADGSPRERRDGDAEAEDPIVDAVRADPRAEELLTAGVAAFGAGEYDDAFDRLRRGCLLAKDSGLARHTFAIAQFALGDYQGAASSLRRAVELTPELPRMGLELAPLYAPTSRDLTDQRLALESHARLFPADRDAALLLAWIAAACGETAVARERFAALVATDPEDAVARAYLEAFAP